MRFTLLALAFAASPIVAQASDSIQYKETSTAEERGNKVSYVAFPGFKKIEIVRDGKPDDNYSVDLREDFPDHLDFGSIKTLQVRQFDVQPSKKRFIENEDLLIPFAVDIRFQEKREIIQGTLNVKGNIVVSVRYGQVVDISVVRFHDSSWAEEVSRNSGIISKYDDEFVDAVVRRTLLKYFSDNVNEDELIELVLPEFHRG